jgi:hypothetical protein
LTARYRHHIPGLAVGRHHRKVVGGVVIVALLNYGQVRAGSG